MAFYRWAFESAGGSIPNITRLAMMSIFAGESNRLLGHCIQSNCNVVALPAFYSSRFLEQQDGYGGKRNRCCA